MGRRRFGVSGRRFGGGALPFTPASIANIRAWYRADSVGVTGSVVDSMTDKTGNGYTLSRAGANRPWYRATDFDHNGYPGVQFNAAAQHSLLASTAANWEFLSDFSGSTVVLRVQSWNVSGFPRAFIDNMAGTSSNPGQGWWYNAATSTLTIYVANGTTAVVAAAVTLDPFECATIILRCYSDGTYDVRKNGTSVASGTRSSAAAVPAPTYPIGLGGYGSGGAGGEMDGKIPEVIFYTRAIENAECAQIESYLTRYDVTEYGTDTAVSSGTALTGTVEVLFVGDSITEGNTGHTSLAGGFRNRISTLCSGYANFTLSAVGPSTYGGFGGMGDAHDGQSGWTIRGNTTSSPTNGHAADSVPDHAGEIDEVLSPGPYTPNIIVLHIGTNNVNASEADRALNDSAQDWVDLVEDMHAREPNARFVLCAIIKNNVSTGVTKYTQAYNRAIRAGINNLRAQGITVQFVDLWPTLTIATDLFDALHPDDSGYTLMGDAIWPAIRRVAGYS